MDPSDQRENQDCDDGREAPSAAAPGEAVDNAKLKKFLEDLQTQLKLYKDMIALNEKQIKLLTDPQLEDPNDLLVLVGDKQRLMDKLAEVEKELGPLKERWPERRDKLPESVRKFSDELLAELSDTVKTLLTMEDETHKMLAGMMASTQSSIQSIHKQTQANRAYAAYGPQQKPKFIDRKTDP